MLLKSFVLLFSVVSCFGQNETRKVGDACTLLSPGGNVVWACQPISRCRYALKRLQRDEVMPKFPNVPEPLPEDPGCPPLDKPAPPPTLNPVQRIAWNKCVENLRYVDQCIAKPDDRDRLIRRYECGIPDRIFRIAGGEVADTKEFPHMVALGVVEDPDESSTSDAEWIGAGALVSDRFVLTAAHVLVDPYGRPLRYALMGSLDKDVRSGLLLTIVRRIPHPLYRWPNNQHDIALLELDRPVPLSSLVRPICLPVPGQDTDRIPKLLITYWVRTGEPAFATELLNTAQVSLLDYSECQTKLGSSIFQYNSSTMLCVKGFLRKVAMDTCVRYNGGPLMSVLSNVKCSYRAEGVMSLSPKCGGGSASVYTRVEHYLDWIVENVWREEWWLTNESRIIHFP